MGKFTVFCGTTVGAASKMKLVVNLVMGTQLAALAEGLALASALGLSSEDVQAAASPSAPPARLGVHSTLATR